MAKYINREQAIDWFSEYLYTNQSVQPSVLLHDLKTLPAADVAPVAHGQWVPDKTGGIRCSACEKRPTLLVKTDFCPRCGAKMDLEG